MYITEEEWLPQARKLLVQGRNRATGSHGCGSGSGGTLGLYREGALLSCYCHRCGSSARHMDRESAADALHRVSRQLQADNKAARSTQLPECTSRDAREWPTELSAWVYSMGLHEPRLAELGMYYNGAMNRLVLPIYQDGVPVFWQARSQTSKPKWLAPAMDKRGITVKYGVGRGHYIVLTEDALSAYKVGLVCEAWTLLGTKLHPNMARQLMESGRDVVVWLDNDTGHSSGTNPGQIAAGKIIKQLQAYGMQVHRVISDRDPKTYPRHEIQAFLDKLER